MPRFAAISAHREREELLAKLARPTILRVRTEFLVHRRNDVPGRVCPCCGSETAWLVARQPDLEVLIAPRKQWRRNAWEIMTESDRSKFEGLAGEAQPWGTKAARVWDVPIRYTCGESQLEQLLDDETMVMLWSGGWRSMKSHTCAQWWSRGWVKHGSQGELFWLAGPQEITAFRLMERIFYGRGEGDDGSRKRSPSVLPCYQDEDTHKVLSMVADGLPEKVGKRDPSFHFVDGSKVELRHAMSDAALEGDDVRRIMGDELVRWRSSSSFKICLGRVTQCGGQFGGATVPDDQGDWVYDEIVGPFEQGTAKGKRVFTMPTYELAPGGDALADEPTQLGNLWLARDKAERLLEQCGDEKTRKEKFGGQWVRSGLFAYVGHYDPGRHDIDAIGHMPEVWGFTHDVTAQAARGLFKGKSADYLGARDFNERPQTGLVAKVFTNDPRNRESWVMVILDEHLDSGDARKAAMSFAKRFRSGKYAGAGLVCDCNGFWDGHRYGGRPSKTTDAFEFEAQGFLVRPSLYTPPATPKEKAAAAAKGRKARGGEPKNPGLSDSKKLVRKLFESNRILIDTCCMKLRAALPRVPYGEKPKSKANTAHDRQIFNFDDCLRYLAWALFAEELPQPKKTRARVRGAPRLGGGIKR